MRAAGSGRERGEDDAGSQEHPTHSCCLLLSPQSGHMNTQAGGSEGGETAKPQNVGNRRFFDLNITMSIHPPHGR